MCKNIAILGSTGSIGVQALDVIEKSPHLNVVGLSANSNIDLLEQQILKFKPIIAAVMDESCALELKRRLPNSETTILAGMDGFNQLAAMPQANMVLTAVVGMIGLEPTLAAIKSGKNIALANKETLVCAGELVMAEAKKMGVEILPVDGEHSAIFQCLNGNRHNGISRIILTASGGPFRGKTIEDLQNITPEQALLHPNWQMGKKITIDSATMMNKGLEVIEAKWLFDIPTEKIDVLVHPQSIIHSMVEFEDASVIAQLAAVDMRLPIQYAFNHPRRLANVTEKLDFVKLSKLTFKAPDRCVFKCLNLAYDALAAGGTIPAVLNSANEEAVNLFLNGKIAFLQIPVLIERAMAAYTNKNNYCLQDVIEADLFAREVVRNCL